MNKIDEFVEKWCLKPIECMKGDDYIMYDEEECRADFRSTVESLLPSDEEIEADGKEGGLRDGELQLYWEGAAWLRSRLLAAIDAKSIAQKPQENDKMLNKDAIDAKGLNNIKLKQ